MRLGWYTDRLSKNHSITMTRINGAIELGRNMTVQAGTQRALFERDGLQAVSRRSLPTERLVLFDQVHLVICLLYHGEIFINLVDPFANLDKYRFSFS